MRRRFVALATAATLAVSGTAVATAQTAADQTAVPSDQASSTSSATSSSPGDGDAAGLPGWATMGSSGSSMLSSDSLAERVHGSSLIVRDWLLGALLSTAFGSAVTALLSFLPNR